MNNLKASLVVRSLRVLTESRPLLGLPCRTLHTYLPVNRNFIHPLQQPVLRFRNFCDSAAATADNPSADANTGEEQDPELPLHPKAIKNPNLDRRIQIPVETSIRYLRSSAFKECYGDEPVWRYYRRNHLGPIPRRKTRKTCIRKNASVTGSPCPICRDEYLVVDYRNVELLKHFISPITGEYISYEKTQVCQMQHNNLMVALIKAKDLGLLTFELPFREYNYSDYIKED